MKASRPFSTVWIVQFCYKDQLGQWETRTGAKDFEDEKDDFDDGQPRLLICRHDCSIDPGFTAKVSTEDYITGNDA